MSSPLFAGCIAYTTEALIGFSGVLSGTFCLERNSRKYGSILLLFVVLFIDIWWELFLGFSSYHRSSENLKPLIELPFIVGGLIAVVFFWLKRPGERIQKP